MNEAERDLEACYELVEHLGNLVGLHRLSEFGKARAFPERGIYIFFEPGELRANGSPRITRIGTHGLVAGSRSTLRARLSQHRGTSLGFGNHRGSIFRLHVGAAIINRDKLAGPGVISWGIGSTAKGQVIQNERDIEAKVSEYIGKMPFTFLAIEDPAGPESLRKPVESGLIGLLSTVGREVDPPSAEWLGNYSLSDKIRNSGLWNVRDVGSAAPEGLLQDLERAVEETVKWKQSRS